MTHDPSTKIDPSQQTVEQRLKAVKRLADLSLYVGGGVAGVGRFGAGDLGSNIFKEAHPLFAPPFITLSLLAGGFAAWAYGGLTYHVFALKRHQECHNRQLTAALRNTDQVPACFP